MTFRPWTFKLEPFPDELLSSWLIRVAFAHGQTPYVFHNLHLPGLPIWSRDVDRAHTVGLLSGLSTVSGLSAHRVKAASLDRYRQLSLGAPAHGEWPFVLAAGIYHRKRRRHGLQFCPNCLGSGTAFFRRSWRLAYALQCPECAAALADACPHCEAPVAPHRAIADMRACHRCGKSICSGIGNTQIGRGLHDSGLQALLTKAASRRTVRWLGGCQRPADVLLTTAMLIRLLPAKQINECRRAIGLPVCPVPISSQRFERQRLYERALRMQTVGKWASDWPRRFRLGAAALGLTRRRFADIHVPPALNSEVTRLPPGQARPRGPRPLLLGPELRAIRKRTPTAYRQERATRILQAVASR